MFCFQRKQIHQNSFKFQEKFVEDHKTGTENIQSKRH